MPPAKEPTCHYCWKPVELITYSQDDTGRTKTTGRGERPEYKHKASVRTDCTHSNLKASEVEFP